MAVGVSRRMPGSLTDQVLDVIFTQITTELGQKGAALHRFPFEENFQVGVLVYYDQTMRLHKTGIYFENFCSPLMQPNSVDTHVPILP